jgi:two-component system NarL family sensor kinase
MQVQRENIILIIAVITGIFLLAALFMFFYVMIFNERKKRHRDEKEKMKEEFDQELVRTGFEVQEQTRKNLAGDLHDNIGQLLSLTSVLLGSVNFEETNKAEQKILDAHQLVIRSIQELRQLSRLIHGEQVLQLGLLTGIKQEIGWLERSGHYTIEFSAPEEEIAVSDAGKDLFVYRLFQESLNNIIKHAQADKIKVTFKYAGAHLLLTIADNGIGFDFGQRDKSDAGLGLHNMQRRVDLLRGKLDIQSSGGQGSVIHISIPYP